MANVIRIIKQKEPNKKRVVVYAFLTMADGIVDRADTAEITDTIDTTSLLDTLQKFLQEVFLGSSDWKLVNTYFDHTNTRPQFARMIADCEIGRIDIILCRSISEFANTPLEVVSYIRRLGKLGIRLMFEAEKIDTIDSKSELLATVMSMFGRGSQLSQQPQHNQSAQLSQQPQLSQSADKSVEQSAEQSAEQSLSPLKPMLKPLYGFKRSESSYEIVADEAEVIRLIFSLYEHGYNISKISDELFRRCVKPPLFDCANSVERAGSGGCVDCVERGSSGSGSAGRVERTKWNRTTIHHILQNEKYAGDIICQKYYIADFRTGRVRVNTGLLPSRFIRNHHEGIISREQFERCSIITELRRTTTHSFYPFGDFLKCPSCGHVLFRRQFQKETHYFCEGKGACREFVILAAPVNKGILSAWNDKLSLALIKSYIERIERIEQIEDSRIVEANKLLATKLRCPSFIIIDYWWLDDFVKKIEFGKHSRTATEIERFERLFSNTEKNIDDRTICISWKCGLETTVPSGVERDSQDPHHKAKLWDAYVMRNPDVYPELVEELPV